MSGIRPLLLASIVTFAAIRPAPAQTQPRADAAASSPPASAPAGAASAAPAQPAAETGNKWYEWENRVFTATLTPSGLYDFTSFEQDENSMQQLGDVPSKDEWRAERVLIGGALKMPGRAWNHRPFRCGAASTCVRT